LAFEEDITVNGKANPRVGLDATKALGAAGRSIIDVLARNDSVIRTDTKNKVGKSSRAGECVAALGGVASGPELVRCSAHTEIEKVAYYEAPETCL
jgi:hypothetical protein